MSKNTYLSLILTAVGYKKQTEHTLGGLSDTFQTTGRQSDFFPNYRWVMYNYPLFFNRFFLFSFNSEKRKEKKEAKMALFQHP